MSFRKQFPLLASQINGQPLVYFDNAATTQMPAQAIKRFQEYYQSSHANVHRASHGLSAKATQAFEASRQAVQQFINASSEKEIIWTKGATESINLIAQAWGNENVSAGDEILVSEAEHHANIVPWQLLAQKCGAKIKVIPLTNTGTIDLEALESLTTKRTKVIAVNHISNVVGKINTIEQVIKVAKSVGAISVIDGAQAIGHEQVNVQQLGCDFYVFSAHKMFGPAGLGVLYGREQLLNTMSPYQGGGEMIETVSFKQTTFNQLPFKFEAGTPNIPAVVAFSACLNFIDQHRGYIKQQEQNLIDYAWQKLNEIDSLNFVFEQKPDIPLFSFTIKGHHNHDIATALDSFGIAVRSGHHCAMPLMQALNLTGCIRLSLAAYNTTTEVDFFIDMLNAILADEAEKLPNRAAEASACASSSSSSSSEADLDTSKDEISSKLKSASSWDAKHRVIMLLGKDFPRMDKALRNEESLIQGCESLAWLSISSESDKYYFSADSDAKVIRGLLAIVLNLVQGKPREQIAAVNFDQYFQSVGLMQHLSPSRGNGLKAIVAKVKAVAEI